MADKGSVWRLSEKIVDPGFGVVDSRRFQSRKGVEWMDERVPLFSLDRNSSTILRGIAILYILLGHTGYFVWGGAGGVVLFLLLSGYGLDRSREQNGFTRYWNRRIRKVWFPYFLVALFVLAGWRILDPRVIVCTLLGLDLGQIADPTMWYISYILLWYLVYYGLARLALCVKSPAGRRGFLLGGLFVMSLGFRIFSRVGFWHDASGAYFYTLAFPLGVALSSLAGLKVREKTRTLFRMAFLFLTSAYMLGAYGHVRGELMALIMGLQPIAVVLAVRLRGGLEKVLLWLGKYSYPIYLFEGLFLYSRNEVFSQMSCQPLIDLTFMAVSITMGLVFWEGVYRKLDDMLPWEKWIRF